MPKRKIKFRKNGYYHIFDIAKDKRNIFLGENDMQRFLKTMFLSNNCYSFRGVWELERSKTEKPIDEVKKILKNKKIPIKPLVKICAFCLMPDHFHFLVKEVCPNGTARFMQKLLNSYAKFFSNRHRQSGSLFRGRYCAAEIENEKQLKFIIAYINAINPAQLVEPYLKIKGIENYSKVSETIDSWQWSSHQDFLHRRNLIFIEKKFINEIFSSPAQYNNFLKDILLGKKNKIWDVVKGIIFEH